MESFLNEYFYYLNSFSEENLKYKKRDFEKYIFFIFLFSLLVGHIVTQIVGIENDKAFAISTFISLAVSCILTYIYVDRKAANSPFKYNIRIYKEHTTGKYGIEGVYIMSSISTKYVKYHQTFNDEYEAYQVLIALKDKAELIASEVAYINRKFSFINMTTRGYYLYGRNINVTDYEKLINKAVIAKEQLKEVERLNKE